MRRKRGVVAANGPPSTDEGKRRKGRLLKGALLVSRRACPPSAKDGLTNLRDRVGGPRDAHEPAIDGGEFGSTLVTGSRAAELNSLVPGASLMPLTIYTIASVAFILICLAMLLPIQRASRGVRDEMRNLQRAERSSRKAHVRLLSARPSRRPAQFRGAEVRHQEKLSVFRIRRISRACPPRS